MKRLIPALVILCLMAGCSPETTLKPSGKVVNESDPLVQSKELSARKIKNPVLPDKDILAVSIGEPHFEISKRDGYNNNLLINVVSSAAVDEPLIVEFNGKKVTVPLERDEDLAGVPVSEAVFLSYQTVDWLPIEQKLTEIEQKIQQKNYSWESDFQPILEMRQQYGAALKTFNEQWNGSLFHYLGRVNIDFSALKQTELSAFSCHLKGKSFQFTDVDIAFLEEPMSQRPVSEVLSSTTLLQAERPVLIDREGLVLDPELEDELIAQEAVVFTGLSFFPESATCVELHADLFSGEGKLIWSRKWKDGSKWNIPGGSSLKFRCRLKLPELKDALLPQTNLTAFYEFQWQEKEWASSTMFNLISRKSSRDLLLTEWDRLNTSPVTVNLARIDLVDSQLTAYKLSHKK
ncbi:hypothetical protein [Proteiniclasticum sp. QWL-01]|uniref:hypothetical protein n=1 Tax=Proteiniclasticum sp. QWL-01 TaxID=3036945 RepID=UPI0024102C71|nr:hypothetical protein [Proteiniclasticum sp. QWL-01]WFF72791.1 hypothetical protein P6M73_16215 [Proteiniclasticum sp. QWL-01]